MKYEFCAKIWLYDGPGAWHFITLPKDISAEIKEIFGQGRRGWGAIRVSVAIGKTKWQTSIFPDKKSGVYLLPLKAEVRKQTSLTIGDTPRIMLELHP
ncbi:DUF1905 domain-containing protein [Candidatus Saccharibacteria bacterium]|nr:DUF1905 domain-containing protein [Candidatus Saccharibacteria bacterium]